MTPRPIDIQVSRSRSKVKLIVHMLGNGGISVLQTSIFGNRCNGRWKLQNFINMNLRNPDML